MTWIFFISTRSLYALTIIKMTQTLENDRQFANRSNKFKKIVIVFVIWYLMNSFVLRSIDKQQPLWVSSNLLDGIIFISIIHRIGVRCHLSWSNLRTAQFTTEYLTKHFELWPDNDVFVYVCDAIDLNKTYWNWFKSAAIKKTWCIFNENEKRGSNFNWFKSKINGCLLFENKGIALNSERFDRVKTKKKHKCVPYRRTLVLIAKTTSEKRKKNIASFLHITNRKEI